MTKERFPLPSQERLHELFDYNAETGDLIAKTKRTGRGGWEPGDVVGYEDAYGYLKTTVDGRPLMLHRVIWKWVTGQEPPSHLDHVNRVKRDNRWANLREADARLNSANKPPSVVNFSGAKGVSISRYTGEWSASITIRGEARRLGKFVSREEAIEAYNAAARAEYGEFACLETGENKILVDVLVLCDDQLLDAFANATRRLWSYQLDKDVPEAVKAVLNDIGLDLSTELARIDPERFGQMRKRAA